MCCVREARFQHGNRLINYQFKDNESVYILQVTFKARIIDLSDSHNSLINERMKCFFGEIKMHVGILYGSHPLH